MAWMGLRCVLSHRMCVTSPMRLPMRTLFVRSCSVVASAPPSTTLLADPLPAPVRRTLVAFRSVIWPVCVATVPPMFESAVTVWPSDWSSVLRAKRSASWEAAWSATRWAMSWLMVFTSVLTTSPISFIRSGGGAEDTPAR